MQIVSKAYIMFAACAQYVSMHRLTVNKILYINVYLCAGHVYLCACTCAKGMIVDARVQTFCAYSYICSAYAFEQNTYI
jgi:hypothetical protein